MYTIDFIPEALSRLTNLRRFGCHPDEYNMDAVYALPPGTLPASLEWLALPAATAAASPAALSALPRLQCLGLSHFFPTDEVEAERISLLRQVARLPTLWRLSLGCSDHRQGLCVKAAVAAAAAGLRQDRPDLQLDYGTSVIEELRGDAPLW